MRSFLILALVVVGVSYVEGDGIFCNVCKALVKDAEDKLNSLVNADEAKVEQIIDQYLCAKMPGFLQGMCKNLVKQYIPEIVKYIESQEGHLDLCAMLHFCSPSGVIETVGGGLFCQECKAFVKKAEDMINQLLNADEAQIEQILDNQVCARLGPLKNYCVQIIKTYIPQIIAALKKGEKVNICAMLRLCSSEMAVAVVEQAQPGFLCDVCKTGWKTIEPIVKGLLQKLEGPIEQKVQFLCNYVGKIIPFIKDICTQYLQDLLPDVIKWLDGQLDHLPFCQDIHVCP